LPGEAAAFFIGLVGIVLVLAPLVYPGELSHLGPGLNRWLYEHAARRYERKWQSTAYRDSPVRREITTFAEEALLGSGSGEVLDLGCGTGRGTRLVAERLPLSTNFTAIDFSPAMLRIFGAWLHSEAPELRRRVTLHEADLAAWAEGDAAKGAYGLVLMLEVGEFVPRFAEVLTEAGRLIPSGGGLIATRPAGIWSIFFPGRAQTRSALTRLLQRAGFAEPRYVKWRARYEIVLARKN
jgi:SAM-dependent methyltransferase